MEYVKGDGNLKMDKTLYINTKGKVRWDLIVLAVISLLCYITPFTTYTYRKIKYTISGLELLMGKTIMKGKVVLEPSIILWIDLVIALLMIVVAVIFPKLKAKWSGLSVLLLGAGHISINVIFATQIKDVLSEAKKVGVTYGSIIMMILGILVVIIGFSILYKLR